MNRTYIFRAWDGKRLHTNVGLADTLRPATKTLKFDFITMRAEVEILDNALVIDQFIGIKDANDVCIYENDILEVEYDGQKHIYVVIYNEDSASFCVIDKFKPPLTFAELYRMGAKKLKVIGNVYQNKNLLEKSSNEQ